ncbi:MAG: MarR family winged helix-turn-helix transcriptional regulator [Propioniciclava sp.]
MTKSARATNAAGRPQLTAMQRPLERTDVITEPLTDVLDEQEFTPRLLALLSNALVWAQSRAFREELGLATNEWRVLSALASQPGLSASEISEALSVNKAVVSTSVNALASADYVVLVDGPRNTRPMYLTEAGKAAHDRMLPIALRGQQLIDAELGADGRRELNALLQKLTERVRRSSESTRGLQAKDDQ